MGTKATLSLEMRLLPSHSILMDIRKVLRAVSVLSLDLLKHLKLNSILESSTNILNNRASNNALATLGLSKGLDKHVIINPAQWGIVSNKTMATTVEALIGAVFIDSGLDINAVRAVMVNLGIMDRPE
jgi:ribonuclease-3